MPMRKQAPYKPRTMAEKLALAASSAFQTGSSSSAASVGTLPLMASQPGPQPSPQLAPLTTLVLAAPSAFQTGSSSSATSVGTLPLMASQPGPQPSTQLAPQTTPVPAVAPQPAPMKKRKVGGGRKRTISDFLLPTGQGSSALSGSSMSALVAGTLPVIAPPQNADVAPIQPQPHVQPPTQSGTPLVVVSSTPRSDLASQSAPQAADSVDTDDNSSDEEPGPIRRGHNKGVAGWNSDVKFEVEFNTTFVPVGPNAKRLRSQLGIICRDPHQLPLTMLDWTNFNKEVENEICEEVMSNLLDPPEGFRKVCWHMCNMIWKNYKAQTKKKYFTDVENDADWDENRPPTVLPDQWATLLAFWRSADAKLQSEQNSKNRDKHGPMHVIGRKSFAELRHERRKSHKATDRMSVWVDTRNKDDPDVTRAIEDFNILLELEPEDQRHLNSVKDRIFFQLVGPDGHGYCRTYGASAPPRLVHNILNQPSTPHVSVGEVLEKLENLESNLKTQLLSHIDNHIAEVLKKKMQDFKSEWMASCPCNSESGSHSHTQVMLDFLKLFFYSVHQKNMRESVGDGALVLSTNEEAALNPSTELGDTEQSAHGVNDEDIV